MGAWCSLAVVLLDPCADIDSMSSGLSLRTASAAADVAREVLVAVVEHSSKTPSKFCIMPVEVDMLTLGDRFNLAVSMSEFDEFALDSGSIEGRPEDFDSERVSVA